MLLGIDLAVNAKSISKPVDGFIVAREKKKSTRQSGPTAFEDRVPPANSQQPFFVCILKKSNPIRMMI